MNSSNKNDNMRVLLNDRFNSLDTYLFDCIHSEKLSDPVQVRRDIDTIKKIINYILDNNDNIQISLNNLNNIVDVLKSCNDTYYELNENNNKIMSNSVEIQSKQILINKDLSNIIYKLIEVFNELMNPIKIAIKMKTADKKSVNNPNFKGLTDNKLQELLDLGYSVNDILIYTSDPNNNCDKYSRSAIYTRIKKLQGRA